MEKVLIVQISLQVLQPEFLCPMSVLNQGPSFHKLRTRVDKNR